MKIQLIHLRDPDNECTLIVFADGQRVPIGDVSEDDIDPGRGHLRSDWNDRLYDALQDVEMAPLEDGATAYDTALVNALMSAADSQFIVDDTTVDVAKMDDPQKCENADDTKHPSHPNCHVYYDQAKGDGYAGKCPSCADASEPDDNGEDEPDSYYEAADAKYGYPPRT